MALPTNIRLGWKSLPGKNALAHYEKSQLMAIKSFIIFATGAAADRAAEEGSEHVPLQKVSFSPPLCPSAKWFVTGWRGEVIGKCSYHLQDCQMIKYP